MIMMDTLQPRTNKRKEVQAPSKPLEVHGERSLGLDTPKTPTN